MIIAVTGLNGAGKTAYACGMLQRFQSRGVQTAANIGVSGSRLVRTFEDLVKLRDCVVLVDEITAVASSRQFQSLTPEALLFFQTLRHANVGLIYTAPTIERCDVALRSLTLRWVALTALVKRTPRGGIWSNTLVSLVRTGRPAEGADGAGAKMLSPTFGLYRPARHHAVYDSFADVDLFSRQTRFPRTCPRCGVGVSYGSAPVSTTPVDRAAFFAEYFCSTCGHPLGFVERHSSDFLELGSSSRSDNAKTLELGDDSLQPGHLPDSPPGLGAPSLSIVEASRVYGRPEDRLPSVSPTEVAF